MHLPSLKKLKRIKKAVLRKENAGGAGMAFAGLELSPITIWNEIYVNFPIAYIGATVMSFISHNLFTISLIFFYWLSNFAGLILLELGVETVLHKKKHLTAKLILLDVVGSVLITLVLVYLVQIHLIAPPSTFLGI